MNTFKRNTRNFVQMCTIILSLVLTFSLTMCSDSSSGDITTGFIYTSANVTDSTTPISGQAFTLTTNPSPDITLATSKKYASLVMQGTQIGITVAQYTDKGKLVNKVVIILTADTAPTGLPVSGSPLIATITAGTVYLYVTETAGMAPRLYKKTSTVSSQTVTITLDASIASLYDVDISALTDLSLSSLPHPSTSTGTATLTLSGIKAVGTKL